MKRSVVMMTVLALQVGVVRAQEAAPASEAPVIEVKRASVWPAYALWGASAASFVVATYYGVTALKAKNDFEDQPSFKLADRAEDRATISDISIGVGISFALIGTLLYFARDDHDEHARLARRNVAVAPMLQQRMGGAALTGRF